MTKTFDEIVKEHNDFQVSQLQRQLETAFYWMGSATASAREGSLKSAAFDMTLAMQYWLDCQHIQDAFLRDIEGIDFPKMVADAIENAKKKYAEDNKDK